MFPLSVGAEFLEPTKPAGLAFGSVIRMEPQYVPCNIRMFGLI